MGKDRFNKVDRQQIDETRPAITVERMILFIAYAINCTDQVKHKTEKIKIIVRGAETCLV